MADDNGIEDDQKGSSASQREERLVLLGLLGLFCLAGLFLLFVTLAGGGIGT